MGVVDFTPGAVRKTYKGALGLHLEMRPKEGRITLIRLLPDRADEVVWTIKHPHESVASIKVFQDSPCLDIYIENRIHELLFHNLKDSRNASQTVSRYFH